jgi:hypothetical protein
MNEAPSDGLGKHIVASIKALCGHNHQGKLTGIQRATGERFLAKVDCLATLEATVNVNIGRDFLGIMAQLPQAWILRPTSGRLSISVGAVEASCGKDTICAILHERRRERPFGITASPIDLQKKPPAGRSTRRGLRTGERVAW